MSDGRWAEVLRQLEQHSYMDGVERTVERVRLTAEVFTPSDLVVEMVKAIPVEQLGPGKSILDPACGDGQFLVAAKWVKMLFHDMSELEALSDLYGVDIMADNVELCRRRLGGGTIVIGDTLNPTRIVPGQTSEDQRLMRELFDPSAAQPSLFAETLKFSHL